LKSPIIPLTPHGSNTLQIKLSMYLKWPNWLGFNMGHLA